MSISVSVGDFVKLGKLEGTPFPKLMRGSIQKVVAARLVNGIQEIQIERQHRGRIVACWIQASLVARVLSPVEAKPIDACTVFAPHTAKSGAESFHRQRCLICKEKFRCDYFQSHHAGRST